LAGWQRAWGTLPPTTTLAFAMGPGFTISAATMARDVAVIEMGIGASLVHRAALISPTLQLWHVSLVAKC